MPLKVFSARAKFRGQGRWWYRHKLFMKYNFHISNLFTYGPAWIHECQILVLYRLPLPPRLSKSNCLEQWGRCDLKSGSPGNKCWLFLITKQVCQVAMSCSLPDTSNSGSTQAARPWHYTCIWPLVPNGNSSLHTPSFRVSDSILWMWAHNYFLGHLIFGSPLHTHGPLHLSPGLKNKQNYSPHLQSQKVIKHAINY